MLRGSVPSTNSHALHTFSRAPQLRFLDLSLIDPMELRLRLMKVFSSHIS